MVAQIPLVDMRRPIWPHIRADHTAYGADHPAGTVATAVSALAAGFFLFPPKFSFWIDDPIHLAELFWLAVLGYVASRAAGGLLRR